MQFPQRILAIAGIVWAVPLSSAAAMCPSLPDTPATGFVENRTAHAVCLQNELHARTDLAAERARLDAELGNIEIGLQRERLFWQQQSALPAWP